LILRGPRVRRLRRRLRPLRPVFWLAFAIVGLSAAWVIGSGFLAARELTAVQKDLTALQTTAGKDTPATELDRLTAQATKHAERAASLTDDLAWRVWQRAPLIGSTLRVTSGVSSAAATLTRGGLPSLVGAAKTVPHLRRSDGGIDLAALSAIARPLRDAAKVVEQVRARVAVLPHSRFGPVNNARVKLEDQLDNVVSRTQALVVTATSGPSMLGFDGSRRYLVAVQNNAEARASGGIVGAYGVLRFDAGKPVLEYFKPDTDLRQSTANVVDFGPEWRRRYDVLGAGRDWREVTATPDFPTAAATMLALWKATHAGEQLDGVISVDPPALAAVLEAIGPVTTSDGRVLNAPTFVQSTLSDAYARFPDKAQRSAVLSDNARSIFQALTQGAGAPLALGERLGHAVVTGHLKVYSADGASEAMVRTTAAGGALPVTQQPYLSVVTQDGNADKLAYYLRRDVTYDGTVLGQRLDFGDGRGPQPQELATITVRLHNTAPASGLPDYVAPAVNLATGAAIPRGQMRVAVSVYLGRSGQLEGAALDGRPISMSSETEQGMAVFTTAVDIDPGSSTALVLRVRQPTHVGQSLLVVQQPLVTSDNLVVRRRDVLGSIPLK
jgi:hypothetical protein